MDPGRSSPGVFRLVGLRYGWAFVRAIHVFGYKYSEE